MKLENGIVKLSGFCEATFYAGWDNDEPVDGFIPEYDAMLEAEQQKFDEDCYEALSSIGDIEF